MGTIDYNSAPEEVNRLIKRSGRTKVSIARELGVSVRTIHRALQKPGNMDLLVSILGELGYSARTTIETMEKEV